VTAWYFQRSLRRSVKHSRRTVDSRKMAGEVSVEAQRLTASAARPQIAALFASGLAEESLCHLDVARHSDKLVTLQRFVE